MQRSSFTAGMRGDLGSSGSRRTILIAPAGTMARTVVAADAVGVDHAILRNPHGMADLDRRFPGEVGQADGAVGHTSAHFVHSGRQYPRSNDISGLHEGHQLARRTQHLIGTHRNTQLASRAMGVEVPQALRSGRNDGRGTVRNLLVDDHRQPAVDLLLLRPGRRWATMPARPRNRRREASEGVFAASAAGLCGVEPGPVSAAAAYR